MSKLRIAFFAQKPIGAICLKMLVKEFGVEKIGFVASNSKPTGWWADCKVWETASLHDIRAISTSTEASVDILGLLQEERITHILSVQSSIIFTKEIIEYVNRQAFNLHLAPLPDYRGWHSASHAILNEEENFGSTMHRIVERVDAGPLILAKYFQIPPDVDVSFLYFLSEIAGIEIFAEFLSLLRNNDFPEIVQRGNGRYYRLDDLENRLNDSMYSSELKKRAGQFKYIRDNFVAYVE